MIDGREFDGYDMELDGGYCMNCDGKGEIMVCIDDMCIGSGECMHGDGMIICPACKGLGE